jgi:hypothetical protein
MAGFKYHGENHEWDLILRASNVLYQAAQHFRERNEIAFANQLGSMVLAFTAIESFTASAALKLSQKDDRLFSFEKFCSLRGFWPKINMVCEAGSVDPRGLEEPFPTIRHMHQWRNNLIHSTPYRVDENEILDTNEVFALHASFHDQEAIRFVNEDRAEAYWNAALTYVDLIRDRCGVDPHSFAGYQAL